MTAPPFADSLKSDVGIHKNEIVRSLAGLVLVAVIPLLVFGGGVAWLIVNQKKAVIYGCEEQRQES